MKFVVILVLLCLAISCGSTKNEGKKLIVVITVDQMRADYFDRFKPQLDGGLKRLQEESVFFSQAYHDHASTETSPGHAVLLTGVHPKSSGIVANDIYNYDLDREEYVIYDKDVRIIGSEKADSVSAKRLKVKTLPELWKEKFPSAKVFSVSGKDRAAILMAGHKADGVFWYNKNDGHFISSSYFTEELPDYIKTINQNSYAKRLFGSQWDYFLNNFDYNSVATPDSFPGESHFFNGRFPYLMSNDSNQISAKYYSAFRTTPFLDEASLEIALEILKNESLGQDDVTDFLLIGFSAMDYIGHAFGPNSHEIADHVFRLDNILKRLFNELDLKLGADNYTVVFSSDHGVVPLPEFSKYQNLDAERVLIKDFYTELQQTLINEIRKKHKLPENAFKCIYDGIIFNRNVAISQEIENEIINGLKHYPFIQAVYSKRQIMDSTINDRFLPLIRNSFSAELKPDILFILRELNYAGSKTGTGHGSPYAYDQHVPLIFMSKQFKATHVADSCKTIDLAPTLAEILGFSEFTAEGQSLHTLFTKH